MVCVLVGIGISSRGIVVRAAAETIVNSLFENVDILIVFTVFVYLKKASQVWTTLFRIAIV